MSNDLVPAALYELIREILAGKHVTEREIRAGKRITEPEPSTWAYDRVLIAKAREHGISPLPRSNALNDPWRRHLEEQIGQKLVQKLVMEELFRRKRGQRGPGHDYSGPTETDKDTLTAKRKVYQEKKTNPYRAR
jgi:hypothetical protein